MNLRMALQERKWWIWKPCGGTSSEAQQCYGPGWLKTARRKDSGHVIESDDLQPWRDSASALRDLAKSSWGIWSKMAEHIFLPGTIRTFQIHHSLPRVSILLHGTESHCFHNWQTSWWCKDLSHRWTRPPPSGWMLPSTHALGTQSCSDKSFWWG